jgi:uncharacterized protein YraI
MVSSGRVAMIVAAMFLLAACGPRPVPASDQVQQLVDQAVKATLAAQATQPPAPGPTAPQSATVPPSPLPPTATGAKPSAADAAPPVAAPTGTSAPSATLATADTPTTEPPDAPTAEPTATPTAGPSAMTAKVVNLRSGPGTNYPLVGSTNAGETYAIQDRNSDGSWFEICCIAGKSAWVAASVVTTVGDMASVQLAQLIPTPPPSPTPAPVPTAAPKPTSAPPASRAGLHTRQLIGTWEIQAERVQNEKAVYEYDSSKVAMGRYAIVFVLAKNLASGTQDMNASLSPMLKDDKGRIYDFSDPLTTERMAMIYACWEFSVGQTVFDDVNPGVETPLLMLWDVNEDVGSLTLILTDGGTRVEWDLGNFSSIPPYKPQ